MLLPSDVARLVLGYLQEEGLSATSQAFIHESPNLKEYAEHSTGDGAIPACVFSVFGKGLTTILTEYVAIKTNETCHEVPAMMTSLWKKLDFTLKQIKAMQNSPATSACQRMRSRVGMANLARQRAVTMASTTAVVCSSVSETATIISPALTSHGMLCQSTPVSYAAPQIRSTPSSGSLSHIQDGGRLLNTPRDSPVQIIVSEHRGNPGPMSPGRRKWDTPRKRGGAASGASGGGRSTAAASSVGAEPQPEEQLVIQNARDKILGDRLLQEKLAENINKILANEPVPQTSKAPSSTLEADQSIDEILGLQGEIHMSDDAIHDILEQTESDPAFQALFDLFDYNKSKLPDGEPGDGDISSCPEETDTVLASTSTTFAPAPSDLGITVQDAAPSEPAPAKRAAPERKTRRSTAPTFIKKTNRSSRIENSSAKLLISHAEHRGVPSTATAASRRKEKSPPFASSVAETPMDIDDFLNSAPSMSGSMAAMEAPLPVSKAPSSAGLSGSGTVPSSGAPQVDAVSNMDKNKQCTQTRCSQEQAVAGPSSALVAPSVFLPLPPPPPPPSQAEATTNLPQRPAPSGGQDAQPVLAHSKAPEPASTFAAPAATVAALPLSAPTAAAPAPPPSATTSSTALATLGPATPIQNIQTSPSSALVTASSECNQSPLGKPTADPSNIVSLKIIISDNQEEDSSGDAALNQAISSISMDKIPTIYLSSPAKSPGGPTLGGPSVASPGLGVPGTPRTNLDEASLAVSGLQSSEAQVNPINAAAVITSPLTGTAAAQQSYIIQLPLDTSSNPGLQAPAASYFVMAEPPATDAESRPVLMPAGVPSRPPLPTSAQFSVTTPTRPTAFAAGPTLILPSPVKPVILPVSVMGQNALGKVQMVSNQLVAIQTPVPIQQSEVVKATSPLDTVKQSTTSIAAQNLVGKLIQPVLPESTSKQRDSGPSHRRILCFDSSAKVQSPPPKAATTATTAKTSPSPKSSQSGKERPQSLRTKPAILGGNKPKRRVETIRCPAEPLSGVSLVKETPAPSQKQTKDAKKSSRKQDHKVNSQDSETISIGAEEPSQPETLKSPDSGKSKSTEITHKHDKGKDEQRAKGSRGSGSSSSDPGAKSGSKKAEKSWKEAEDNGSSKSRAEKRTPSQEMPSVTANKENEMKSGLQEQSLPPPSSSLSPSSSTSSAASSREVSPPAAAPQSGMNSPTKTPKSSKTSSLAKQAAEMLQDIHSFNSPPKAAKKTSASSTELPAPQNPAAAASAQRQDPPQDCSRTPTRPRRLKDGEGTPKRGLLPPNTPEVPTCSPASETGSENSINMAAHTLMILSRAAIARTGTPLKDSLRQEGVGDKSPAGSKNPKKRKQPPASTSPPAKKDAKESSGKKKERERKKFIDCFPHDLDVDKFLSSLHYDE